MAILSDCQFFRAQSFNSRCSVYFSCLFFCSKTSPFASKSLFCRRVHRSESCFCFDPLLLRKVSHLQLLLVLGNGLTKGWKFLRSFIPLRLRLSPRSHFRCCSLSRRTNARFCRRCRCTVKRSTKIFRASFKGWARLTLLKFYHSVATLPAATGPFLGVSCTCTTWLPPIMRLPGGDFG